MSIAVWLVANKCEVLEVDELPLSHMIAIAREEWNEDDKPFALVYVDDQGFVLATMMRDNVDPEVCHTLYCNGMAEHHRCHYLVGRDGEWIGTEVTALHEGVSL